MNDRRERAYRKPVWKEYTFVCSGCNQEVTEELPFEPQEGRNVYCKECHLKKKRYFQGSR